MPISDAIFVLSQGIAKVTSSFGEDCSSGLKDDRLVPVPSDQNIRIRERGLIVSRLDSSEELRSISYCKTQ